MAPHSSTPAWKIPWTEDPGRLQYLGSLRVRHDWAISLSLSLPLPESKRLFYTSSLLESKIPVLTVIFECIWPFIFSGSVSADSTNPRSKIFGKMFKVSKNKTWICHTPVTNYIALTIYSNFMALMVKNPHAMWEIWVRSLHWEDPLEKSMVTHSSILA